MYKTQLKKQAGQMMVSGFEGTSLNPQVEDLIVNHHVGGFILFERNFQDPDQLKQLILDMQNLARSIPPHSPLFISVDQEGGRVSRLKPPFTQFPHPCCLGAARSDSLAHRFGLALGREMRSVGVNMDYAPVLDVHTNPGNPIIGKRALSDQPQWAARLGAAFIDGFKEAGVVAVGKHFPGHGDTSQDSHLTLPHVDRDAATLEHVELVPFDMAIQNGLEVIMTAHVIYKTWDEKYPATFSPYILKTILRKKLGFTGIIMSDDLEMKAVQDHIALESFPVLGAQAGIDCFLICHDTDKVKTFLGQLVQDLENGLIPHKTIEQSVQRILNVKNKIPPVESAFPDLKSLAKDHQKLVEEMQKHLAD